MKHHLITTSALLSSAGYNHQKWTRHKYSHSELVTLPGAKGSAEVAGLGHMFRCEETGELRRWGFDATFAKDNGAN
jgi:hypothetical protein